MGRDYTSLRNQGFKGWQVKLLKLLTQQAILTGDAKVFYVDPTKSTSGQGTTPASAFATLQEGIDACTADRGDVIVRMPGTETPTATITADCAGITIIGSTPTGPVEGLATTHLTYSAASFTTAAVLTVSARCRVIGLAFESRFAAGPAIAITNVANVELENCVVSRVAAQDGITITGGTNCTIKGCYIGGYTAGVKVTKGTADSSGIKVLSNDIIGNTTGVSINATAGDSTGTAIIDGNTLLLNTTPVAFNTRAMAIGALISNNTINIADGNVLTDLLISEQAAAKVHLASNRYLDTYFNNQLDTETGDKDIKTAPITVLTHTPSVTQALRCQGLVMLGDGAKVLDGTGGNFTLLVTIDGQDLEPSSPITVVAAGATNSAIQTPVFCVPANSEVVLKVQSPNVLDADVTVTSYLFKV